MTIHVAQILTAAAEQTPDREALIDLGVDGDGSTCLTYAEWHTHARGWAAWLKQADVGEGDRVALLAGNGVGFAAQWFGVIYAGATVVPIPVTATAQEVRHRLEHARCSVLICDEARLPLARSALAIVARRPILLLDSEVDVEGLSSTMSAEPNASDSDASAGDGTAMILYTSGTTAEAKGACISHRALVTHTRVLAESVLRLRDDDRVLGVLPLTHSYGCRMLLLAVTHARATSVLMPRFDARRSLRVMDEHCITWVPAVPTMFAAWSNTVAAEPKLKPSRRSLRWAMSAGAPITDALVLRAEDALGVSVRQAYGMTEATLSTVNGPDEPRLLGSVGRAVPGVELRVTDASGERVEPGAEGELWVRGHNLMSGYLDDADATTAATDDGWIRSGDVARVDADGDVWLVDRIKDLIIRGGYNVVPAEVEAVIAEHQAVAEVAVIGRPDAYYGEEVVACVVRRQDATVDEHELMAFCEARLSKVKRPREVRFYERLPLGPSGKVLKRRLREELAVEHSSLATSQKVEA